MNTYQRQIILPQIGEKGQQKLADSRVLVIGAGGLGCALLPYLNASGIGTIGIVDGDTVEESNLHRQVLYTPETLGHYKVDVAKIYLKKQQPKAVINTFSQFLTGKNAVEFFEKYDLIVDATDRIGVRYLINDTAVLTDKPVIYGSIHRFEGQVSVFNYKNGPTYRCLFPKANETPSCAEAGVLGTSVGFIGMMQAQEVMKIILQVGEVLSGKLLMYNTLTATQQLFEFSKNSNLKITKDFYTKTHCKPEVKALSFKAEMLKKGILIDVREPDEQPRFEEDYILKMPLSKIKEKAKNLNKNENYFVFCQSGKRAIAAATLLDEFGFENATALKEGADRLKKELREMLKI